MMIMKEHTGCLHQFHMCLDDSQASVNFDIPDIPVFPHTHLTLSIRWQKISRLVICNLDFFCCRVSCSTSNVTLLDLRSALIAAARHVPLSMPQFVKSARCRDSCISGLRNSTSLTFLTTFSSYPRISLAHVRPFCFAGI